MQKQIEREFISITNANPKDAQKYLKQAQYNLQNALNLYFSVDYKVIDQFFDLYKGFRY
jgi:hypothetical protein